MSIHYVSILPIFQRFTKKIQKQFILHRPKSYIQFLSECLVNLLRVELKYLRKVDLVKYRKEISELTRRRTSLHKKRAILSSPKGLQLISLITPLVIKRLTSCGSVCSNYLLILSFTKYTSKKFKNGTKARKRGDCTNRF